MSPKPLDRTCDGRILPSETCVRISFNRRVSGKNSLKVFRVEHNQMIRALATDRADQAFNISVLPRRMERRRSVPDPHRSHASLEGNAERSVIVTNEIFRLAVPWKRFC